MRASLLPSERCQVPLKRHLPPQLRLLPLHHPNRNCSLRSRTPSLRSPPPAPRAPRAPPASFLRQLCSAPGLASPLPPALLPGVSRCPACYGARSTDFSVEICAFVPVKQVSCVPAFVLVMQESGVPARACMVLTGACKNVCTDSAVCHIEVCENAFSTPVCMYVEPLITPAWRLNRALNRCIC
jgi:hypothetical protein